MGINLSEACLLSILLTSLPSCWAVEEGKAVRESRGEESGLSTEPVYQLPISSWMQLLPWLLSRHSSHNEYLGATFKHLTSACWFPGIHLRWSPSDSHTYKVRGLEDNKPAVSSTAPLSAQTRTHHSCSTQDWDKEWRKLIILYIGHVGPARLFSFRALGFINHMSSLVRALLMTSQELAASAAAVSDSRQPHSFTCALPHLDVPGLHYEPFWVALINETALYGSGVKGQFSIQMTVF